MRYKLLGKSGIRVSEICLGTMTFGEEWGWGASKEESKNVFDEFANQGGNFIDTANRYTEGTSEKYIGEFISSDREHFVLATKYTLFTKKNDVSASGNNRKNMVQALDASLKRLGTEYIDLYWIHAWDFTTPEDEVMRALEDMVRAGKILTIGISDTPAWVVSRANTIAELRGWSQFVGLQVEYSLTQRTVERDLIPMARQFDMAVLAWAPLAGGALTGKYIDQNEDQKRLKPESARLNEKNTLTAKLVVEISKEIGCKPSSVALNWLRQQQGTIIPLVGARTSNQLLENLDCINWSLNNEQIQRLNAASAIDLGFPHDFLVNSDAIIFGGMSGEIDNHRKNKLSNF
ncbi:MAG: aldo/keto reductase [Ignavibacteria bacterium]|nr:aldo/keto reductase [Ignavibacteria bacterium]